MSGGLPKSVQLLTGVFDVSGLFGGSPKVPDAPPPPSVDEASIAGQDAADKLRRRRGMASTILSGNAANTPTTQTNSLLGS